MRHVSIQKIAHILGITSAEDAIVDGYQIDSRRVGSGDLFFAIEGVKTDGHQHLKSAALNGAVAAVVSAGYSGPNFGLVLLRVENVVASLQHLATSLMQDCRAKIIGITGSLGKTMTKDFIATLLEQKFKVTKTHLNYNSKLTYPITLLNRRGDEDVLVVEMGMSEPGEIARLVQIQAPDIAVLTKVALVHVANFQDGIREIALNKADIFSDPRTKISIFDHAVLEYPEAIEKIHSKKLSFSIENRNADYFLSEQFYVDERGVRAYQFDPPYTETHVLHNFLAAIAAARAMKMDWDAINAQVPKLTLPKMRFERFEKDGVVFINDAYNANPDSMKAALMHMPEPKEGGKRIAVLGMMVDMGEVHEAAHRDVGSFAQKCIDHLLVIGKEASGVYDAFQEVQKPAEQYEDFQSLSERLKSLMRPGDVVLFKASRAVEMEKIFNLL